jgi:hypothetical protein
VLRAADEEAVYLEMGWPTMIAYMEARLGYTPKVATERLRLAWALEQMPEVAEALDGKALGYAGARELTRVATPRTAAAWVKACEGKTVREIEELVSGREKGDLPDAPKKPMLVRRTLRFDVTPDVYALYREARRAVQAQLGHIVTDDDVFAEMCRAAIDGRRGEDRGDADVASPAHQVSMTVCEVCEAGMQVGAGTAVDVSPAVVAAARCDAVTIGRLDDGGEPARATQTIPPKVRRAVWARDHGRCQVPGCRSTRFLHIHHVRPRSEGGGHEMWNLILLCGAHHRLVHEGAITLTGRAPGELVFRHETYRGMSEEDLAKLFEPDEWSEEERGHDAEEVDGEEAEGAEADGEDEEEGDGLPHVGRPAAPPSGA